MKVRSDRSFWHRNIQSVCFQNWSSFPVLISIVHGLEKKSVLLNWYPSIDCSWFQKNIRCVCYLRPLTQGISSQTAKSFCWLFIFPDEYQVCCLCDGTAIWASILREFPAKLQRFLQSELSQLGMSHRYHYIIPAYSRLTCKTTLPKRTLFENIANNAKEQQPTCLSVWQGW